MARFQSLAEALQVLWHTDPEVADEAIDYLADLGRLDTVVTRGGPMLVLAGDGVAVPA